MNGSLPFNRMPRIHEPLPNGEVKLPGPPSSGTPPRFSWFTLLMPLTGVFLMITVYGSVRGDWRLVLPMAIMSGFSVTGSIAGRLMQHRHHKRHREEQEAAYAQVLQHKQTELDHLRREQQRIRTNVDPPPADLLARARTCDPRLWERRPSDADFLCLRLGSGDLPSSVPVSAPHPPMPDPRLAPAHALEREYVTVPGVPTPADLRSGPLGIAGPPEPRAEVARALLCHLVTHHAPHEVRIHAVCAPAAAGAWHWLKWLPHTGALDDPSAPPPLADDPHTTAALLKQLLEELHRRQNRLHAAQFGEPIPAWPWLVVFVEEYAAVREDPAIQLLLSPAGRELHVTGLFTVERVPHVPAGCSAVAEVQPDGRVMYSVAGAGGASFVCQPDRTPVPFAAELARHLAPLRVEVPRPEDALPASVHLLDLMGIEDVRSYDAQGAWGRRRPGRTLRVPIGERRGNQPLVLDLTHTGHGPHGLIAGTTGSGKSELLQTLVVGLALTHHPHDVGFILVDFKGGGAFSGLVDLPHTQGFVTDLGGNLTGRALIALQAEMDRRKRLFNVAGVNDIDRYQRLYWQGHTDRPLPRLVIIVDEFAELVSDYPDFIDGLIGIARVGRSLGLHLILATQSPAGVVKQQMWANAKFRICLRVESRQESMEMLRRPEAANLPRTPGRGYFQVGNNDVFEIFQVARVAGNTAARSSGAHSSAEGFVIERLSSLGRTTVLLDDRTRSRDGLGAAGPTDLERAVERLAQVAQESGLAKLPSPWPDPLPAHVSLPALLAQTRYGGWDGQGWSFASPSPRNSRPWLGALLGLQDDPSHQRQVPLLLELDQQDGHLLLIGAPGSGKEMVVRTLVTSLARTHTPEELHFYLLEFGGQALHVLRALPHSGGLFTPLDDERVPRLFRRLLDELEERKQRCARSGVDRLRRLREVQPDEAPAAILLVITGFLEFRTLFADELLPLARLVREGGSYGIHVVLLGDRAGDVPTSFASVIVRRIALRLADESDYGMVLGSPLRPGKEQPFPPGRGWYGRPPLEFQAASPDQGQDERAQVAELQQLVERMGRAWQGARPKPVETLQSIIPLSRILESIPPTLEPSPRLGVPLGLDALRLRPAYFDLVADGPHFLVAGTPQGGKTTLLLTWALALAEHNGPQHVQFVLVSGRRDSLRPLASLPHVLELCASPDDFVAGGGLVRLMNELTRRESLLDTPSITGEPLSSVVTIFDDYDEFSTALGGNREVQQGLERLVRRGRDVKFHLILTGPLPGLGVGYADPLVKHIKIGRSGFLLRVLDAGEQNPLGVRARPSDIRLLPPGRGYGVRNGIEELMQVATPGDEDAIVARARELQARWAGWENPWPQEGMNESA